MIVCIIILMLCRKDINENLYDSGEIQAQSIIKVEIIDKYNRMKELYANPKEEKYVIVDIILNGKYYKNVGIRTKGSTVYGYIAKSRNPERFSFKIKLDYIEKDQKYAGISEFHLNTGNQDKSGIREYLIYEIYNQMGIETQKYALGELKINGINSGTVTVVEVINEEYIAKKYNTTEGNLYKPEGSLYGANLIYSNNNIQNYKGIFDTTRTKNTDIEDEYRLIEILKNVAHNRGAKDIENYFIDFDKVIKMVAIDAVVKSLDNFAGKNARNYYLYEENGKLDIMPFDFNMSFGLITNRKVWNEEDLASVELKNDRIRKNFVIEIILNNEQYYAKYWQYVEETVATLDDMDILNKIDEIENKVDEIKKKDQNPMHTYEEYRLEIENIKNFIIEQKQMIKNELEKKQ